METLKASNERDKVQEMRREKRERFSREDYHQLTWLYTATGR